MSRFVAVVTVVMLAGCPMEPGETRCATAPVFGTVITRCRSAPSEPARAAAPVFVPPQQPTGFWCSANPSASFGYCVRGAGTCESVRQQMGSDYGYCFFQQSAVCAYGYCFYGATSCVAWEHNAGRDGNACQSAQ